MSWSHHKSGPALEVARAIELEGETVQSFLSDPAEKALHARAVALLVVACHEGKEHDVKVEAFGHFDGKHNHVSIKFDGVDKSALVVDEPTVDVPVETPADTPAPATKRKAKAAKA